MKTIIGLLVLLSLNVKAEDRNIIFVSVGTFQYEESGAKNYTTKEGETGTMNWTNKANPNTLEVNYLRNYNNVYVGGAIGNNSSLKLSLGYGF